MNKITRSLLIICGTLCVVPGVLGMIVPVLPTTPFLLLAAVCYARSSDRFYRWLLNNRWFGEYIRNYRAGLGMPRREKALTLIALWLTIGFTALFVVPVWWGKLILLGIATGVTVHLVRLKTLERESRAPLIESVPSSEEPS